MNNIFISIIIPVYNVSEYLKQCLESIINQTYPYLEIILVNDGSTDDSLRICCEYESKDSRVKLISQVNQGLSGARNTGLDFSTGDYILFVDSDDWIDLETCQLLIDNIKQTNADVVLFSYQKEFSNQSEEKFILDKDLVLNYKESRKIFRRIIGLYKQELKFPENADSIVTAWGKFYKTEIIKKNKITFIDCNLIGTEDMLFNVYVFNNVKSIANIHRCMYHYRKNNLGSLTSNYKSSLFQQWYALYNRVGEFIKKEQLNEEFEQALDNRICLSIIGLGLNELSNPRGFRAITLKIKVILDDVMYKQAFQNLDLKYFPVYWKLFFFFAKHRMVLPLYFMLVAIKRIIKK